MENSGTSTTLQSELDEIIQEIQDGETFTCCHKSTEGERCRNTLSKTTSTNLAFLLEKITALLRISSDGIGTLLEEASYLIMCVEVHQSDATVKYVEWSRRIADPIIEIAQIEESVKNLGLAPTIDLLKHNPTEGTSQNQDEMLTKVLGNQQLDRASSLKTGQPLYGDGSDDLGYESADDGQFETQASAAGHKSAQQLTSNIDFEDSGVLSRDGNDLVSSTTSNIVSSSTTRYTGTQTPLKAEKPVSTDSAISMSFNTFDEAEVEKSTIKYRDGSESPLARKGARGKQNMLENQSSRPAPTPLQPVPIAIGIRRKMIPFEQPFVKMKTYIKKPLVTELDMKEGYIYGFGIDGCSYTKIGYVTERSNSASLEDAFIARMNEHKRCYLPKPTIMLKIRVPHAHRMEKIIHYHLEAGRMKYKCYCKKVNEDKPGTGNHTEWFNQSLNEIHAVANAWKDWIRSNPYVEDQSGGRRVYHLSKEWKSRLENVPNANGRDNWLDWLHHYSPVPPQLINKAKSDEIFEKSSTGPVNGSFVRHSTIGTRFEIKRATTFSFS